ncbi:MAG TPA: M48 family peptidase [Blastocatellia bacterium]|nr:M48 family peptidase [Blastocatellia bacterium]
MIIQRNEDSASANASLESIFNEALRAVVKKEPRPPVEARFYPYAGLSSTIRLRRGRVLVRVSDILKQSPPEVLYALACILVSKLYRLKTSREHQRTYREYASTPAVLDASEAARRKRGYKLTTSPRGKVFDLEEVFADLNARYFGGQLERPLLSWSLRRPRRILGHHDHVHGAIIISRTLDSPRIPRFVLEYVLYHEMLHVKHPARVVGHRTIYHSASFRADERLFERYEEALDWLEKIAAPVRRRRKTPRRRRF